MPHFSRILFSASILFIWFTSARAEPEIEVATEPPSKAVTGFIDLNYYPYDTRDFGVLTVNLLADLPQRFEYFSFVNYETPVNTSDNEDLENFYTEQNITWYLPKNLPLGLQVQWAIPSGPNNDVFRFGLVWVVSKTPFFEKLFRPLNVFYLVDLYPVQIDPFGAYNWQIQHVYNIVILPGLLRNRLYLGGFADHNINSGNDTWVTEHQLGVRLIHRLYAVAEYRHTDLLSEKNGVGFGAEYKISF